MNVNRTIKHIIIGWAFFLMPLSGTLAQTIGQPLFSNSVKTLQVGDSVPDLLLDKITDGQKTYSRNLHDFKDQLLIIDFWSTGCSGCIQAFPRLDSLQKALKGKFSVLLSTYEKEATVKSFMARNPIAKTVQLSSLVEDQILGAYFEHRSIPHEVWIYKGVVVAITGTEYIREDNIRLVLSGQKNSWPVKREFLDYDYDKPLLNIRKDQFYEGGLLKYSAVLGYQDGVAAKLGVSVDSLNHTRRGYLVNLPLVNAYFLLWMKLTDIFKLNRPHLFLTPNQLVVDEQKRDRYWFDPATSGYRAAWERKNDVCVEVVIPDSGQTDQQMYRYLMLEMNRLLGQDIRFQNQMVDCLILQKAGGQHQTDATSVAVTDTERAAGNFKLLTNQGSDAGNLVYHLNLKGENPPAFDESGYAGKLDLDIKDWTDIPTMNKQLKPLGLELAHASRPVDMFVVEEYP